MRSAPRLVHLIALLACSALALGRCANAQAQAGASSPADHRLLERYDGHLTSADGGFSLTLFHDGTAAADWSRTAGGTSHYTGTYTGADGNYTVKLTPQKGDSLSLTTRSTGGMVTGQYSEGAASRRAASSLKLMEVDSGNVKLKSTSATARRSNANRTSRRGRSSRSAAARARQALNRARRAAGRRINP